MATRDDVTCWSLIRDAAGGDPPARERFARAYLPVVRAYLAARWTGSTREADDAAQDVFVECFRAGGLLENVDPDRAGGFRAFLLGAVRNVARRHESRRAAPAPLPVNLPADDTGPEQAFDRAWAKALMREAGLVQAEAAARSGPDAVRRVELLRLRFREALPIREIAARWGADPAEVHRAYATARAEFHAALRAVVGFHMPGAPPGEVDRVCAELLSALG